MRRLRDISGFTLLDKRNEYILRVFWTCAKDGLSEDTEKSF